MKISKTNTIFENKHSQGGFLFLFFSEKQQRQRSWIPDKDRSSVLKKQTLLLHFKKLLVVSVMSSPASCPIKKLGSITISCDLEKQIRCWKKGYE